MLEEEEALSLGALSRGTTCQEAALSRGASCLSGRCPAGQRGRRRRSAGRAGRVAPRIRKKIPKERTIGRLIGFYSLLAPTDTADSLPTERPIVRPIVLVTALLEVLHEQNPCRLLQEGFHIRKNQTTIAESFRSSSSEKGRTGTCQRAHYSIFTRYYFSPPTGWWIGPSASPDSGQIFYTTRGRSSTSTGRSMGASRALPSRGRTTIVFAEEFKQLGH